MNYCFIALGGRLTHDPKVRGTGDTSVCHAPIAINRRFKKVAEWVEEPVFVDVTMFGKRGEAFARHHAKGDPAFISGSLRFDRWEDPETGASRSKLYVVAGEREFVKAKPATAEQQSVDDWGRA